MWDSLLLDSRTILCHYVVTKFNIPLLHKEDYIIGISKKRKTSLNDHISVNKIASHSNHVLGLD